MEDADSYKKRLAESFKAMFVDSPDIVFAQEVEFGTTDGINFTEINNELMEQYTDYIYVCPSAGTTKVVTYFKRSTITITHSELPNTLHNQLKCFSESPTKLLVHHVLSKTDCKHYLLANVHAEYAKSNTPEVWKTLRSLFDMHTEKTLIVSGDFNLTLANRSYFDTYFKDFAGSYIILETPEPPEIGNPTYDLILCSTKN